MASLEEKLVEYIDDAYAMEQNVLRMLDSMIGTTKDPQMKRSLERHKKQTEEQAARLEERLREHDASPSKAKEAGGVMAALMKSVLDVARSDSPGRNARDGFATEHMEIASYELLKRIAERANDPETVTACDEIIAQERAMADTIAANWDKFAELSLHESGVPA